MNDYFSVSDLNKHINKLLENDLILSDFWIKGELSGVKLYQQSGHLYFTLKDKYSSVSSVMFKSRVRNLKFEPENGMEVLIRGYVSVYNKQGRYQIYVEEMQPYGKGGLFLYLEQLKEDLRQKGYFNEKAKKQIPKFAKTIGVVTSQDSAALRDILKVLKERNYLVHIIIAHSSVQGEEAPYELACAIKNLNKYQNLDVIIIGRGGGSLEDLMAFNSEKVVKAIYYSKIPVISAVGHETDFSLCDFAADLRAATPTQAAQLAVPDLNIIKSELENINKRIVRSIERKISNNIEFFDRIMLKRVWTTPEVMINQYNKNLIDLQRRLIKSFSDLTKDKHHKLVNLSTSLDNLSPLKILNRGYSITVKDEEIVKSIEFINEKDNLNIKVQDGIIEAIVTGKEYGLNGKNKL
ncbi:Exodeoxyribonuclease VII large subunit [Candidatus Syntrophocurvum alkaliphilum]|uniref:Exodeoxyribonuclease 7 large subunit n=1 Tax=Candidatus Syntrophocurvum alkaliphilum TaxID=2293317 RepID=A0A6I6DCB3_9FIRM|nr:exodeoxyribonuclease VII large subunit [Candidatus Syntrophocurvum alkaliphilum]QGT98965.1 Exodeoxyribonuclease VII large subunit [Candidatus Syntrophocurvum alkaliphilum]